MKLWRLWLTPRVFFLIGWVLGAEERRWKLSSRAQDRRWESDFSSQRRDRCNWLTQFLQSGSVPHRRGTASSAEGKGKFTHRCSQIQIFWVVQNSLVRHFSPNIVFYFLAGQLREPFQVSFAVRCWEWMTRFLSCHTEKASAGFSFQSRWCEWGCRKKAVQH